MKKRIVVYAIVAPLLLLLGACAREPWDDVNERLPDGTPVTLTIGFGSSTMTQVDVRTKVEASEAEEARVHDVYVMLFDANDGYNKIYGRYFSYEHLKTSLEALNDSRSECWYVANKTQRGISPVIEYTEGAVKVSTVAKGSCRLVLLANVSNTLMSLGGDDPIDRLNRVTCYSDLDDIQIRLKQDVVERKNLFLMMGQQDGFDTGSMTWNTGGTGTTYNPATRITITPIDAKVTFRIKVNPDYISAVTPKYWQVFKVPKTCNLLETTNGGQDPTDVAPFDTGETYFENVITVNEGGVDVEYHTFTFYMLENRFAPISAGMTSYHDRELQVKDDDPDHPGFKKNGDWVYANRNSTYVTFDLVLTLNDYGISQLGQDVAQALTTDAIYTVHLGNFGNSLSSGGYTDFNTLRGHSYVYTITVNNSRSIYTEVEDELIEGPQPGQEGFLLLTKYSIINCDAHYEVHNMTFTYNPDLDPVKYSWYIKTPFGSGGPSCVKHGDYYLYPPDGDLDYKWVKFKLNDVDSGTGEYEAIRQDFPGINAYDPDWTVESGAAMPELIDVSQLVGWLVWQNHLKKTGQSNVFDSENHIRFSAFIDEYYYETHPFTGETTKDLWRDFVNAKPRELHILSDAKTSIDRRSDVIESSHSIIQQSIQTIYNIYEPSLRSIWGTEHTDEMKALSADGWPFGTGASYYSTKPAKMENGRMNTAKLWGVDSSSPSWYDYLDFSVDTDTPVLKDSYRKMLYSCMTRNRDNNGNRSIDPDEVRWYLASINQLIGTWVGNEALSETARPYRPDASLSGTDPTWWHAHVVSSTCDNASKPFVLTAEEGVSYYKYGDLWVDGWNVEADENRHQSVRCMRNIGTYDSGGRAVDISSAPFTQTTDQYYERTDESDGTFTINFKRLNPKALRAYNAGAILAHDEHDDRNKVYLEFIAQNPADAIVDPTDASTWPFGRFEDQMEILDHIEHYGIGLYCPEGYRLPNQRELAVMTMALDDSYWQKTYAWLPTCTMYSHGIFGLDDDLYNGGHKLGWVYSQKGIHIPNVGERSKYLRCIKDRDRTGTINGQLSIESDFYVPGDRMSLDFKFSSTASALTLVTLTLCYYDGSNSYREIEIPVNKQPTGLQYNTIQYYIVPSLESLGLSDSDLASRTFTLQADLLNAGGNSKTVTTTFTLKDSHISEVSLDLPAGKTVDGFPVKVTARSLSSRSPINSLKLYRQINGVDDGYDELIVNSVQYVDRTIYTLASPVEGNTYTYSLVAECADGTSKTAGPVSMKFYKVNFSPNGSTWRSDINNLNFDNGDYIETRISLSGENGGNPNKDGLLAIGTKINTWQGSGVYNYQVYYHYDTVSGVTGKCMRTAVTCNGSTKSSANKLYPENEVDMLFKKEGFYIAGSLTTYTTWSSWGNLATLQAELTGRSTLQVGQEEGNRHSYSTYQYLRSVHK